MVIIWIPVVLLAYLFDRANPGFQTIFIKDIGINLLNLCALLMTIFLAGENLLWRDSIGKKWFFTSRIKDKLHLLAGYQAGIAISLFAALTINSAILCIFLRITHGVWFLEIFYAAWLIFLQVALWLALLILLSTFLSKFMTMGMGIIIYAVSSTALMPFFQALQPSDVRGFLLAFFLALIPDMRMFSSEMIVLEKQPMAFADILTATAYALFLIICYLLLGSFIAGKKSQ
jgi:hypothetical protein